MPGPRTIVLLVVLIACAIGGVGLSGRDDPPAEAAPESRHSTPNQAQTPTRQADTMPTGITPAMPLSQPLPPVAPPPMPTLPNGRTTVYPDQMLVAYYGSSGGGALGVLGEKSPDASTKRLRKAAAPFATPERPVQIVYELIVTVADAHPGKDGNFNHSIKRAAVQRYIDAAHRNGALVVLDLQPGRANFLDIAKRWKWALKDPWVGLALDPEWRMGKGQVPAKQIGSVKASEINQVAAWLAQLTRANNLPQKLFLVHTFKTSMIEGLAMIAPQPELAMVLHVDGYGRPGSKLATFKAVIEEKPAQMYLGFKLFYDEDVHLMKAAQVAKITPRIDFVSYQ